MKGVTTMTINEKIKSWRELYAKRSEIDKLSAQIKEKENELKGEIMSELTASGQDGVKISKLGSVSITQKVQVQIDDLEKLCEYMFADMESAIKHNSNNQGGLRRPISDALLFQQSVLQSGVNALLDKQEFDNFDARSKYAKDVLGVNLVVKHDLSFRSTNTKEKV